LKYKELEDVVNGSDKKKFSRSEIISKMEELFKVECKDNYKS